MAKPEGETPKTAEQIRDEQIRLDEHFRRYGKASLWQDRDQPEAKTLLGLAASALIPFSGVLLLLFMALILPSIIGWSLGHGLMGGWMKAHAFIRGMFG